MQAICSVGALLYNVDKDELVNHLPDRCYKLYGLTEEFATVLDKNDSPCNIAEKTLKRVIREDFLTDLKIYFNL